MPAAYRRRHDPRTLPSSGATGRVVNCVWRRLVSEQQWVIRGREACPLSPYLAIDFLVLARVLIGLMECTAFLVAWGRVGLF
jgi:hypothetical protein